MTVTDGNNTGEAFEMVIPTTLNGKLYPSGSWLVVWPGHRQMYYNFDFKRKIMPMRLIEETLR